MKNKEITVYQCGILCFGGIATGTTAYAFYELVQLKDKDKIISGLIKENGELKEQIVEKNKENAKLNKTNTELKQENKNLKNKIEELNQEIQDLCMEVHILRQQLWDLKGEYAELLDKYHDLEAKYADLELKYSTLKAEYEKVLADLKHCIEERQECVHELANLHIIIDQLKKEIEGLNYQVNSIPFLALQWATLKMVQDKYNITTSGNMLFNGTAQDYHKETLYQNLTDKRPLAFIITSTSGHTFGGALNISWPQEWGYKEDESAFTFSVNNQKICTIIDSCQAVFNTEDNFLQFGQLDIMVNKGDDRNPTGEATANSAYDCGNVTIEQFYNNGKYFTVKNLMIYQVDIIRKEE